MLIGSREKLSILSSQPELSIDNVPLEKVTSVKSLGILIDENLRWQMWHFCIWRNGGRTCFLTLAKFSATIVKCRHLQLYCFDGNKR